jgi:hypothetical protein
MEILNSGSFIPLDNREKIEQLIFTACTLASEVSRSQGFQSNAQSNQQIGLELWKGAEYMTRSHEEVTIRNIFLSKFLERLREIDREVVQRPSIPNVPGKPAIEIAASSDSALSSMIQTGTESESGGEARDEFLGVVDPDESVEDRPSYADECVPEGEDEIASMLTSSGTSTAIDVSGDHALESPDEKSEEASVKVDINKHGAALIDTVVAIEDEGRDSEEYSHVPPAVETAVTEQSVKSVVLSEKEPYNFDSCTVTAVLQLLPQADGVRDCVVSVRSHDFAPKITFTNVSGEDGHSALTAPILTALEQYRNALPALAAEKMKKEQAATKKRTSKTTAKSLDKPVERTDKDAGTTQSSSPITQEQAKDQQSLFAS